MKWLNRLRTRYALQHHPISHEIWREKMHKNKLFDGLSTVEKARLRELSILFLQRKHFVATQGVDISASIAVSIAAQACLPILKLGLDYYDGWSDIILYPSAFKTHREVMDDVGLVSIQAHALDGEAWQKGPILLSLDTIDSDLSGEHPGHNLVVHEFAHKLDMLNGKANGMPPLHPNMIRSQWTNAFKQTYQHLQQTLEHHRPPHINPYAGSSPAEFFAVCSEYFFAAPLKLYRSYPQVYHQLTLFYRQDPKQRQTERKTGHSPR